MNEKVEVWTEEELKHRYGKTFVPEQYKKLDVCKIPDKLHVLIPYAQFWGIADDMRRERLVKGATPIVKENLKAVIRLFNPILTEWLAGSEADSPTPSNEYVAFAAMVMAGDYA